MRHEGERAEAGNARQRKGGDRGCTTEKGRRLGSHREGKEAEVRIMQIKREQNLGSHEAG